MSQSDANGLVTQAGGQVEAAVAAATSQVLLASPYMGAGVLARFALVAKTGAADWRVLTRLDAAAVAHGSLSTQGLRQLLGAGVELRSLRRLHAKVFLSDDSFGLVGSANLTDAGLGTPGGISNIELGVALDTDQRHAARKHFERWWSEASPVTEASIKKVEEAARHLPASVSFFPDADVAEDALSLGAAANKLLDEAGAVGLWVKAVYGDEQSVDVPWGVNDWFSSSEHPGTPSFKVGDLVLIYEKYAQRCNAVVQVTSLARHDKPFMVSQGIPQEDANRWPWVNDVKVRYQVPISDGVPLSQLGFTGQSLQSGRKRLRQNEFAAAVRYLAEANVSEATTP